MLKKEIFCFVFSVTRIWAASVPFATGVNLNPRMDKYVHYRVWNEITYPFPNFNSAAVEVC